jgi:CBS domain-containing protein
LGDLAGSYRRLSAGTQGAGMRTLKQVLDRKGGAVWSISPDALIFDALKLMAEKEVGALLVLEAGRLVGVISERDYARKVILKERSSLTTPVRDIMTRDVVWVHPEKSVEECMAVMTDRRIRHLPVLAGDEIIGVVSIGDLVKACIDEKDFTIRQLEAYITGNH